MKAGFDRPYKPACAGMLRWSRIHSSHGHALFGSRVRHREMIQVTLTEGEEHRNLGGDWHFGGGRIISEILMSPMQWADFISTPNSGSGVPVTLDLNREGDLVQHAAPTFETESDRMEADYRGELEGLKTALKAMEALEAEVGDGRGTMTKADRKRVSGAMSTVRRTLDDSIPFLMTCFAENMEKTVTEAKASVEAHVHRLITETGLEGLREQFGSATPQLTHDEGDEK